MGTKGFKCCYFCQKREIERKHYYTLDDGETKIMPTPFEAFVTDISMHARRRQVSDGGCLIFMIMLIANGFYDQNFNDFL